MRQYVKFADMSRPIQILIVDEHPAVRQALTLRLNNAPDMRVVEALGDVDAALDYARDHHPHVVLVETKRADGRGLEAIDRLVHLAHNHWPVSVVVLTSYPSEWERWAVEHAGAVAYLLKDISSVQLLEHIRQVASSMLSASH